MLSLILGGARSGKSRFAQQLAMTARRVTYIATAQVNQDPEMAARIAGHCTSRPRSWRTMEEPLALASAVDRAANDADAILIDCLTIWLGNLFWQYRNGTPQEIEDCVRTELERISAAARCCQIILVSNELGSGTVPEASITRAFRDTQGLLNQWAAHLADEVIVTVAGLPLYLKKLPQHGDAP
jgi:adenosylcobinamide kinase / adenosylcobinamide-phosphate guanylyltransferase